MFSKESILATQLPGGGPASDVLLDPAQWDDLKISVAKLFPRGGGNDPTPIQWRATNLPAFGIGDELSFIVQVPHTYLEGSLFRPHVHWTPHARGVAEAGAQVSWAIEYTMTRPLSVFPPDATLAIPGVCTGQVDFHEIAPSVDLVAPNEKISTIITGRIFRDATGDTWATNVPATNLPALMELDFHFMVNTLGSKNEFIK